MADKEITIGCKIKSDGSVKFTVSKFKVTVEDGENVTLIWSLEDTELAWQTDGIKFATGWPFSQPTRGADNKYKVSYTNNRPGLFKYGIHVTFTPPSTEGTAQTILFDPEVQNEPPGGSLK